jgi:hypothetical protein
MKDATAVNIDRAVFSIIRPFWRIDHLAYFRIETRRRSIRSTAGLGLPRRISRQVREDRVGRSCPDSDQWDFILEDMFSGLWIIPELAIFTSCPEEWREPAPAIRLLLEPDREAFKTVDSASLPGCSPARSGAPKRNESPVVPLYNMRIRFAST